jgi:DNA (cytosine-5)-methyltransferase 1
MTLTIGSLFSGIGGLEYGLELTGGFKTIWNCEIEAYPSAVLRKHWPDCQNLGDIKLVDWATVRTPDVLCGGFPCQDISVAGKGAGIKEGTRSGLWSKFAKAIGILRPRYVVIENVPMLANRGLDIVLADIAKEGYDAEWHNISAASVGAWHKRERIFIIATNTKRIGQLQSKHEEQPRHSERTSQSDSLFPKSLRGGCDGGTGDRETRHVPHNQERNVEATFKREQSQRQPATGKVGNVSDTNSPRFQRSQDAGNPESGRTDTEQLVARQRGKTRAEIWAAEPDVGRVANGVSKRVERIKCLGNAVVPQAAQVVGEMILEMEAER